MRLKIDSLYLDGFNDWMVLSKYSKLKYKIGDKDFESVSFSDKTPGNYKDGLYLVVDKKIISADKVWFEIVIRNNQYNYYLKK